MIKRRIVSVDELIGKLDMDYNWELGEFETFQESSHPFDKYGVFYFWQLKGDYKERQNRTYSKSK